MEKIILPNGTPGRILTPDDSVVEQAAMTANAINSALMPDNFDYTHSPSDNEMAAMEFKNPRQVNELKYIIKDILSGDQAAAKDERYSYLNFKQIKTAIEWIQNNNFDEDLQALLVSQPWKLVYKTKPPTPEEFLTNKYIGAMADNLFLPVKKNFLEFFDPIKPYRNAYLNPSIGAGKSTFTMMSLLYVACLYALMRDPWKFFSKAKTTIFAITLCAVTITKAKEIYEEPIRQLIESADFWKQCRTHSEMMEEEKHLQECDEVEYIPWKNGNQVSVFNTGNNLQWKVISSANSLLGVNILFGCMTEITFFLEAGKGWTEQKIFNFFSKLKERISNRFQNAYLARMILDSSPSTLEDPIQNYMTYDAPKLEESFIWKGARWELYPEEFPDYCDIENKGTLEQKVVKVRNNYDVAFQLYKGGNGKPPVACENPAEASQYNPADLIWCPKKQYTKNGTANFLQKAKDNPIEFMKDWAGLPAGTPDRLFYRDDWIEECFNNGLKNQYGAIVALANEEPEHLIWNQIWPRFFQKLINKYKFYYEPDLPRTVSVDLSKAKDCTGIAMSHVELDPQRIDEHTGRPLPVYVTDFTIVLVPKGGHINMDAVKYFIHDLKYLGNINLRHVSFDGWQSDAARQYLKRDGIAVDYVSVDTNNEPYYNFYDLVTHGRYNCGKNIFVKNNMKSLHEIRRVRTGSVKIDHFEGPLNYDWEDGTWESCTAGINAKDATDAIVGSLYLTSLYPSEFIATKKFYKEDNLDKSPEDIMRLTKQFTMSGKLDGGIWQ
jgi:hypothetical protein